LQTKKFLGEAMSTVTNSAQDDVKKAAAAGSDTSETVSGSFDLDSWVKSMQQTFLLTSAGGEPSSDAATEEILKNYDSAVEDVMDIAGAREKFSKKQAVANIHVESDNFIRDNITGK
jgi:hypothetical protein